VKNNLKKKRILILLSVLFILVIPAILIVLSATWLGKSWTRPGVEEEVIEHLKPSQILADKIKYRDQFVVIQGRVVTEDTVCEKKSCPPADPCCGCENERDLIISDSGESIITQKTGRLALLTPEKKPYCQRETNSCDYNCADWQLGQIYEVKGIFRATPPPQGSGLKIYLDYYFEVQEKKSIRNLGIIERTRALIDDIRGFISSTSTSGYYILH